MMLSRGCCDAGPDVYRRLSPDTADKVDFIPIHALARDLLARNGQHLTVRQQHVDRAYRQAWERAGVNTPLADLAPARYWRDEIDHVIKGRGLRELADYEAVDRRGRAVPLIDGHKHTVWTLLHAYQDHLDRAGTYDNNDTRFPFEVRPATLNTRRVPVTNWCSKPLPRQHRFEGPVCLVVTKMPRVHLCAISR
jgi:hypothetical protein